MSLSESPNSSPYTSETTTEIEARITKGIRGKLTSIRDDRLHAPSTPTAPAAPAAPAVPAPANAPVVAGLKILPNAFSTSKIQYALPLPTADAVRDLSAIKVAYCNTWNHNRCLKTFYLLPYPSKSFTSADAGPFGKIQATDTHDSLEAEALFNIVCNNYHCSTKG